jgi:hypothetical protein
MSFGKNTTDAPIIDALPAAIVSPKARICMVEERIFYDINECWKTILDLPKATFPSANMFGFNDSRTDYVGDVSNELSVEQRVKDFL